MTPRIDSDPPECVSIIMACPECSDAAGGSIEAHYYDSSGHEIEPQDR